MTAAEALYKYRMELDLSLREAAALLEIKPSELSKLEHLEDMTYPTSGFVDTAKTLGFEDIQDAETKLRDPNFVQKKYQPPISTADNVKVVDLNSVWVGQSGKVIGMSATQIKVLINHTVLWFDPSQLEVI